MVAPSSSATYGFALLIQDTVLILCSHTSCDIHTFSVVVHLFLFHNLAGIPLNTGDIVRSIAITINEVLDYGINPGIHSTVGRHTVASEVFN